MAIALSLVIAPVVAHAALVQIDRPPTAGAPAVRVTMRQTVVIGQSVQGRDIVAQRIGTPGGRVVLVVGNTHGDEPRGIDVGHAVLAKGLLPGVDLWVIDTINPDGYAAGVRGNANGVDLNRNFEINWSYIAPSTTHRQFSGNAPADQPETQAIQNLIRTIQPQITVWYHQDADRIGVSGARRQIPLEYARIVGQSTGSTPCTARCTGTGTRFTNDTVAGGTAFLVELPNSSVVTPAMVELHAAALRAVVNS